MEIIENKEAYNNVKASLNLEDYLMLRYSKKAATRLAAAEYYYSNRKKLEKYKAKIESRIKVIY